MEAMFAHMFLFVWAHPWILNPFIWMSIALITGCPPILKTLFPPVKRLWKENQRGDVEGHTLAKVILAITFPIMFISGLLTVGLWPYWLCGGR